MAHRIVISSMHEDFVIAVQVAHAIESVGGNVFQVVFAHPVRGSAYGSWAVWAFLDRESGISEQCQRAIDQVLAARKQSE
jgi:hypothetical protein